MNNVYFELRGEFNTDDHYTGAQIMKVILKTIKVCCETRFQCANSV